MYCEAARCSAFSIRLFWKMTGWGELTIAEPRQAGIATQRGRPGDGSAPVMTDQRKLLDAERVGERENVVHKQVGLIRVDILRQVRSGEAPEVGHDETEAALQPGSDLAPRPVRFREAVQQDYGRARWVAG